MFEHFAIHGIQENATSTPIAASVMCVPQLAAKGTTGPLTAQQHPVARVPQRNHPVVTPGPASDCAELSSFPYYTGAGLDLLLCHTCVSALTSGRSPTFMSAGCGAVLISYQKQQESNDTWELHDKYSGYHIKESRSMFLLGCPYLLPGFELPDPFEGGRYMYMEDLQVLNSMTPPLGSAKLPERLTRVVTPLKSEVWERYLQALPDKECAQYMVKGLSQGFHVGFNYRECTYSSARCNM